MVYYLYKKISAAYIKTLTLENWDENWIFETISTLFHFTNREHVYNHFLNILTFNDR